MFFNKSKSVLSGFRIILSVLLFSFSSISYSQLYVAVDGSDENPGTIDLPLKTITRAIQLAAADTTIFVRGGVHEYNATIRLNKTGQADKPIKIWAYPGEKPIIDFSSQPVATSSRGFQISHNYWYVKGLEIRNAGDNGIHISGWYNLVEECRIYHCYDTGIQLSNGASHNKIINCDSYENCDKHTNGENADGFAAKLSIGPGNEFHGCRAWGNADDGWDLYEGANAVIINDCWAFRNGYNVWGLQTYTGDGNGFKVGGNYVQGPHIVTRSVAFDNKQKGFDQNNNTAGITLYNNTSFRNGTRNFSFPSNPASGKHILKNNISHRSGTTNSIVSTSIVEANSWVGFTINDSDFISLDTSLALSPRNADSSLPYIDFLRLSQFSLFIDAGVDVGLSFNGTAPDLGAFETDPILSINENFVEAKSFKLLNNYPNPFNPTTTIAFLIDKREHVKLAVYDITGTQIDELVNDTLEPNNYSVRFDGSRLSSGIYFVRLSTSSKHQVIKLLLMK
jgi:hypothetical protein